MAVGFGGGPDGLVTTSTAPPLFAAADSFVTLLVGLKYDESGGFPVCSAGAGGGAFFSFFVDFGILIGGSLASPVGNSADTRY